mmetsp:Transcript_5021/g.15222  ORF Transcript_5021/g.15222 Transcript_5021/m.15222 type:complete len:414 (+) Transcript_5021:320-1561(+)
MRNSGKFARTTSSAFPKPGSRTLFSRAKSRKMDTHECTQPVLESQLDSPSSADNAIIHDDNALPWGRLIPSYATSSGVQTHDFYCRNPSKAVHSDVQPALYEMDAYTIGRNRKCDVIINDSRVSGCHCRIYRSWEERPGLSSRLMVYLEDTSSNGTFLNKSKLKRRERRPLSTGDELTFLSPKISEAHLTSYMYVNMLDKAANHASPKPVCLEAGPERSLTLAVASASRSLEKDYELREELGSGSIGKVYRAIERKSDEAYAAKIIPVRQFALERSFSTSDLLQEARMLRNVSHPAIVSIRDAYKEEMFLAIIMQLVEGGDLFDRILKRKKYPEDDARDVMTNLLSALAYLHARGIAHRDIKPENILLRSTDSDVDVLLTDFGLAKGKAVSKSPLDGPSVFFRLTVKYIVCCR